MLVIAQKSTNALKVTWTVAREHVKFKSRAEVQINNPHVGTLSSP
jgi:hypothetical protein